MTHAIGQGKPPEGAVASALCGKLQPGDFVTRTMNIINCKDCINILAKR